MERGGVRDGDVGAGAGAGVEDVHDFVIFALVCPSHDERNVEDSQRRNKRRNMRNNSKMLFLVFPSSLYLLSISFLLLLLPPLSLFLSSVFIRFFSCYLFNPNSFSHVYSHIRLFPLHLCPWRFQSTFSSLLFSSEWRGVVGRGREKESNCVKEREAPTFSVPATE